jgi:flagellar biosynthesis GTPase FlhF
MTTFKNKSIYEVMKLQKVGVSFLATLSIAALVLSPLFTLSVRAEDNQQENQQEDQEENTSDNNSEDDSDEDNNENDNSEDSNENENSDSDNDSNETMSENDSNDEDSSDDEDINESNNEENDDGDDEEEDNGSDNSNGNGNGNENNQNNGSITVCKMIVDQSGNVATTSNGLPSGSFSLTLSTGASTSSASVIETPTWSTGSFSPDTRIISDSNTEK